MEDSRIKSDLDDSFKKIKTTVRSQFSHLATHKDSIVSEHPVTQFGRTGFKNRTSPLPNTYDQTSPRIFPKQDKPETASDFAVPDIKPKYKQSNFNTSLFQVRNPSPTGLPVFSNLQQLKQQIVQQRGRKQKRPQPQAYSTKTNGFGVEPAKQRFELNEVTHFSQQRNSLTKPKSIEPL